MKMSWNVCGNISAVLLLVTTVSSTVAQTAIGTSVPVTADNFNRAETDLYFGRIVKAAVSVNSTTP